MTRHRFDMDLNYGPLSIFANIEDRDRAMRINVMDAKSRLLDSLDGPKLARRSSRAGTTKPWRPSSNRSAGRAACGPRSRRAEPSAVAPPPPGAGIFFMTIRASRCDDDYRCIGLGRHFEGRPRSGSPYCRDGDRGRPGDIGWAPCRVPHRGGDDGRDIRARNVDGRSRPGGRARDVRRCSPLRRGLWPLGKRAASSRTEFR